MTPADYEMLKKAYQYREVDTDYRQHLQAYLNFSATSKVKSGKGKVKAKYSTFKKFYDYESELKKLNSGGKVSRIFKAVVSAMKGGHSDG